MLSRFERFILDLTEIDLYWHRLANEVMKPYGRKGSQVIYFTKLSQLPNGATAAELCALCGKDKADVSRDVAELEQAGFLYRDRSKGGYRAPVELTQAGRELTRDIIARAEQAVGLVGQELSEQDRTCFYRVLDQITKNLQTLSEQGLLEKR